MIITGGKVTLGRTLNLGDYNSKRFDAEIHWMVDEGEDGGKAFDAAAAFAVTKLAELMNGKSSAANPAPAAAAKASPAPAGSPPAAPKAPGDPKAAYAAKAAPVAPKVPPKAAPVAPAPAPAAEAVDFTEAATTTVPPAQATLDDWEETAPADISDNELNEACAKRVSIIKDPKKIRECAIPFGGGPSPLQLRNIAQDKRRAFLEALALLK
jgi:hypothetical protein